MRERFRTTVAPLLLLLTTPLAVTVFWITVDRHGGSLLDFLTGLTAQRLLSEWPRPTFDALWFIGVFVGLEAVFLVALPGPTFTGPVTPLGNRPSYKLNGILSWLATHALFYGAVYRLSLFEPGIVYDHFGAILSTLNLLALGLCVVLHVKGSHFPSSSDAGRRGNLIHDFFWGVELHPAINGVSLKQLINARIAMMGWSIIAISFAAKQEALYGRVSTSMLVSLGLQVLYILKFFVWEGGYFASFSVTHERFGFYQCWGVLCWIPGVYALSSFYLVTHPVELPLPWATVIGALGLLAIWMSYDADSQRQRVRLTNGSTTVWGKNPLLIMANYRTSGGNQHQNPILVSGWWGVSRHFHYLPELVVAFAWSLPALFNNALPYFYVVYLMVLLVQRSGRLDRRCEDRYGADWASYVAHVKYRIVPFVY